MQLGSETGLRTPGGDERGTLAANRGVPGIPASFRLALSPLGALADGDSPQAVPDLAVAGQAEYVAFDAVRKRRGKCVEPRAGPKEVERHRRAPEPRAVDFTVASVLEVLAVFQEPLRLVGHVGLDIHQAVSLYPGVVVPGRANERRPIDHLEQVVGRVEIDRGFPGARGKGSEQVR